MKTTMRKIYKLKQVFMLCTAMLLCVKISVANPADSLKTADQPTLANILNPNGTLKPGVNGSFSAQGYTMSKGKDGQPIFLPSTLAAGDENWDNSLSADAVITTVNAVAVIGTDVYIGANNIYKWSGTDWEIVGGGVSSAVHTMAVKGTDLYVGGPFTTAGGVTVNRIAKWNGTTWSALGTGTNLPVHAITIRNTDIYVGGEFTQVNGNVTANRIAKYDGTNWSTFGTGVTNGFVKAITFSAIGDMYVGGSFTQVQGVTRNRIAKWDGTNWSAAGGNGIIGNGAIYTIAILGADLYVGGEFSVGASNWAVYKGDTNLWTGGTVNGAIHSMIVSGTDIYVSGYFTSTGLALPTVPNRIARYDSSTSTWNALGTSTNSNVRAMTISGTDIYIGGEFTTKQIHKYNTTTLAWSSLGTNNSINNQVKAVAISGTDVYVGGVFNYPANRIAKWNGTNWSSLGTGIQSGEVRAIAILGTDVYVGGTFTNAGGTAHANYVARWNTTTSTWHTVSGGLNGNVNTLVAHNGKIYAGGEFTHYRWEIGGNFNLSASRIAVWDPANLDPTTHQAYWASLGGYGVNSTVHALAVHDTDLYVGGTFLKVDTDNKDANRVAKWNITNSTWSALGTGTNVGVNGDVYSIVVSSTGDVYVGGTFTAAAGSSVSANLIAKYSGNTWSALGTGIQNGIVHALAIVDDVDLYAGGTFTTAGGSAATGFAKWNGVNWNNVSAAMNSHVYTMIVGGANKVYIGGNFTTAGSKPASYFVFFNPDLVTLPVTLTSFTAKTQNNSALLNWQTASESNNSHFVVKRSTNGVDFTEIASISAKSTSGATYNFTDYSPANGTNYYQLLQVDLDGETTDLGVKTITFNLQTSTVSVYPNPAKDKVKLNFQANKFTSLKVVNLNGQQIFTQSISQNQSGISLNLANYTKGVYVIHFEGLANRETVKLVKE